MKMKKKMKKAAAVGFLLIFNLSVAGLSFLHASAYGLPQQQITVQGKVVDAQNLPVPGASVLLKGTMTGTITDTDGYYSLTIGADVQNPVLVFSFVGMVTQEIAVGGRSTINVTMVEDVVSLDEVVAIGYGSVKRSPESTGGKRRADPSGTCSRSTRDIDE